MTLRALCIRHSELGAERRATVCAGLPYGRAPLGANPHAVPHPTVALFLIKRAQWSDVPT
jgi:hypothetical protein